MSTPPATARVRSDSARVRIPVTKGEPESPPPFLPELTSIYELEGASKETAVGESPRTSAIF